MAWHYMYYCKTLQREFVFVRLNDVPEICDSATELLAQESARLFYKEIGEILGPDTIFQVVWMEDLRVRKEEAACSNPHDPDPTAEGQV